MKALSIIPLAILVFTLSGSDLDSIKSEIDDLTSDYYTWNPSSSFPDCYYAWNYNPRDAVDLNDYLSYVELDQGRYYFWCGEVLQTSDVYLSDLLSLERFREIKSISILPTGVLVILKYGHWDFCDDEAEINQAISDYLTANYLRM